MSSEAKPLMRDVYSETCTQLINLRDRIADTVKQEAAKARDVNLKRAEITEKALAMVSQGYSSFQLQASETFKLPPWSDITSMFIVATKNQYFFSPSNLLGEVIAIVSDIPKKEIEPNNDWHWL